jgi:hypothetical protein
MIKSRSDCLYRHLGCFERALRLSKSESELPTSRLSVDLHAKLVEKAGDQSTLRKGHRVFLQKTHQNQSRVERAGAHSPCLQSQTSNPLNHMLAPGATISKVS